MCTTALLIVKGIECLILMHICQARQKFYNTLLPPLPPLTLSSLPLQKICIILYCVCMNVVNKMFGESNCFRPRRRATAAVSRS